MTPKKFILALLTFIISTVSYAGDNDCILIKADGAETSYLVSQSPKIYYQTEDGIRVAKVLLGNSMTPVLTVQLTGDKTLKIMYPSVTDVNAILNNKPLIKDGKRIEYGRVVIIKNGRKYNVNGVEIKE